MNAEDFLKSKGIKKESYEGIRIVDSKIRTHKIVDLLNEYAENRIGISHISIVSNNEALEFSSVGRVACCDNPMLGVSKIRRRRYCKNCDSDWID